MLALIVVAAAYACFLYMLRQRMLPVIVMRAWFTLVVAAAVIASYVLCCTISLFTWKIPLLSKSSSEGLARWAKTFAFKSLFFFNAQHLHVEMMEGSLPFSAMDHGAICSCHTSFLDSLLFLCIAPFPLMWRSKTFLKSSLRNMPLFGYVLRCAGHFPVYFADENSTSFSVNKEKQAKVAADSEEFLSNGGSLAFFPEGAMNRNPEVLKDFRLGSFNMILKHKLPLFYLVVYGNHEVWSPSLKSIPGYPADLYIYVGQYKYDAENEDAMSLSVGFRAEMQKQLDKMLELRKSRGYQPWWNPTQKSVDAKKD